ncbi:hypothetical protein TSAR_004726 [Trichomalopsis sarcophagae]|uniref:Caspase family p20 domain-containing protein n=1 Tax=Trichomalopsis sarcophagae TaxID=543379 RepID=A0A232EH88_9HYME|nr:hypothetical protein TSAR_004726 [Trichomalopsis sarcophagae]
MQAFCLELKENGTRYVLLTLLTFVCQPVAIDFESNTPDNITMHQQKNSVAPINQIRSAPTERDATHYNMNHGKRGLAFIFNHEFFSVSHLKARCSTNVDCENLAINTLESLGFEVNDLHNSTHKDISKYLEKAKLIWQKWIKPILKERTETDSQPTVLSAFLHM